MDTTATDERAADTPSPVTEAAADLTSAYLDRLGGIAALAVAEFELAVRSVPTLVFALAASVFALGCTWLVTVIGAGLFAWHAGVSLIWITISAVALNIAATVAAILWVRHLSEQLTFSRLRSLFERALESA